MKNNYKFLLGCISFLIISFMLINAFIGEKIFLKNNDVNTPVNNLNATEKTNFENEISKMKNEYNSSDAVGFISFPSNGYNALIMQTTDNDYYLNHSPDGKENYAGSIVLDYRIDIDKSKKLLIYGHSSKYEILPFNFLQNYYNDEEYFYENRYIEIVTNYDVKRYEIFSVYVETYDFSYMETDFVNDDEYLSHIEGLKNKSIYDTDVILSEKDDILILQTCSTHDDYKDYENKYLLIISRRV